MRPSLRFLALAVVGWGLFRAASLGAFHGFQMLQVAPSDAKAPPIAETHFPAIEPVQPATAVVAAADPEPAQTLPADAAQPRYVQAIVGQRVAMRPGVVTVYQLPPPSSATASSLRPRVSPAAGATYRPAEYTLLPPFDLAGLSHLASDQGPTSVPATVAAAAAAAQSVPALDQQQHAKPLQLSTWALLRPQQTGVAGAHSLAPLGQLGASQAGARLLYNINHLLALSGRLSTEVGRRGGEGALGVRVHPLASIPIWFTAERRQAIGRFGGGRNAFALFAEGGVYGKPLGWRFLLDGYFEGGVVGLKSRDLFFDGALTATRPLFRNFSAGLGVWGGAQPSVSRLDVGPRVTMRVRKNVKVHLDWRQKIAGNARPGSGPALTLAGDF